MDPKFEPQLKALKEFMESMPAFSPATQKLIELSNDLNASPKDVVKAVRMDPVLTGKVFELVNSAYFNLPEKVTSLNRVVVYLGINTVKNIALAATVNGALASQNKEVEKLIKPIWRHSLAAAVSTKTIAKTTGIEKKRLEEFFIAGLLHDLGKIVLIQTFHESSPHDGTLDEHKERELYGLAHTEVVHALLKKWNFPEEMATPVMHHLNPTESDENMAWIIHLANYMTYEMELNQVIGDENSEEDPLGPDYRPLLAPEVFQKLNTTKEEIIAALEGAKEEIKKAEMFLNA